MNGEPSADTHHERRTSSADCDWRRATDRAEGGVRRGGEKTDGGKDPDRSRDRDALLPFRRRDDVRRKLHGHRLLLEGSVD